MFLLDMLNPLFIIGPAVAIVGVVIAIVIAIIVALVKKLFRR